MAENVYCCSHCGWIVTTPTATAPQTCKRCGKGDWTRHSHVEGALVARHERVMKWLRSIRRGK